MFLGNPPNLVPKIVARPKEYKLIFETGGWYKELSYRDDEYYTYTLGPDERIEMEFEHAVEITTATPVLPITVLEQGTWVFIPGDQWEAFQQWREDMNRELPPPLPSDIFPLQAPEVEKFMSFWYGNKEEVVWADVESEKYQRAVHEQKIQKETGTHDESNIYRADL